MERDMAEKSRAPDPSNAKRCSMKSTVPARRRAISRRTRRHRAAWASEAAEKAAAARPRARAAAETRTNLAPFLARLVSARLAGRGRMDLSRRTPISTSVPGRRNEEITKKYFVRSFNLNRQFEFKWKNSSQQEFCAWEAPYFESFFQI